MKRLRFSKRQRLLSNSQFRSVLALRSSARDEVLTVFAAPNEYKHARFGISVGRSCGGAVVRNRLKRFLREVFRQSQDRIPVGFDYVVMLSRSAANKTKGGASANVSPPNFEEFNSSMLSLAARAAEKASKAGLGA